MNSVLRFETEPDKPDRGRYTKPDGNSITVRLEDTMLEAEESIQEAVNKVRMALEHPKRMRSDTDGSHRTGTESAVRWAPNLSASDQGDGSRA